MSRNTDPTMRWWAMRTLCNDARQRFHENEPKSDLFSQQEMLNAWPFVVTGYNGIELAIKALRSVERPDWSAEETRWQWRNIGHDIFEAFCELTDSHREHIEFHYAEHRSLFDYDSGTTLTDTAEQFIRHLSGKEEGDTQGGLLRWRYAPLTGSDRIPTTSVWTMYEIWSAVCCCLHRSLNEHQGSRGCASAVSLLRHDLCNEIILKSPLRKDESLAELNGWVSSSDCGEFGVLVDLLCCIYRDAPHEVNQLPTMRDVLWANGAAELRRLEQSPRTPDERQLFSRIRRSCGRLVVARDALSGAILIKDDPTSPPTLLDTATCEDPGVKLLVEDLCIGNLFSAPGLGRISWAVSSDGDQVVASSVQPGLAKCSIAHDAVVGHLLSEQPAGDSIPDLGRVVWEVTRVDALTRGGELLEDRWIQARGSSLAELTLTIRVNNQQQVVDVLGHVGFGLYEDGNAATDESGCLYYFQTVGVARERLADRESLRALRREGFRYHTGIASGPGRIFREGEEEELKPEDLSFSYVMILLPNANNIAQAKDATEAVVRLLINDLDENAEFRYANTHGNGWVVSVHEEMPWHEVREVGLIHPPQTIPLHIRDSEILAMSASDDAVERKLADLS